MDTIFVRDVLTCFDVTTKKQVVCRVRDLARR